MLNGWRSTMCSQRWRESWRPLGRKPFNLWRRGLSCVAHIIKQWYVALTTPQFGVISAKNVLYAVMVLRILLKLTNVLYCIFRSRRVKREAQDLVQKLQKEIDELKKTIDELDKNPDLQVSPESDIQTFGLFNIWASHYASTLLHVKQYPDLGKLNQYIHRFVLQDYIYIAENTASRFTCTYHHISSTSLCIFRLV